MNEGLNQKILFIQKIVHAWKYTENADEWKKCRSTTPVRCSKSDVRMYTPASVTGIEYDAGWMIPLPFTQWNGGGGSGRSKRMYAGFIFVHLARNWMRKKTQFFAKTQFFTENQPNFAQELNFSRFLAKRKVENIV